MSEIISSEIDPRTFRDVLGCYPTGVSVITSVHQDVRLGLVVGSFTSISLDPPLVGFFPGKGSRSWPMIEQSGRFCVNVLGGHQIDLCKHFASKVEDKFANVSHGESPSGLPVIDQAVAWIDCRIKDVQEIGDHYLVVGAVESMSRSEIHQPLVFLRGGYLPKESSDTLVARAEYRVREDFAERNIANIMAFLPEVRRRLQPGSRYSVSVSPDRRSFLHLFFHETEAEGAMLGDIPAFNTFLDEVTGGGCEVPPSITHFAEL